MSDSAIVAYYKKGTPYNAKGEPIIIITGHIENGPGTGGGGGFPTGPYGGATSQSGHALAKWSTENLKKTKIEQERRIVDYNKMVITNTNAVRALADKLKGITDKAVAAGHAGPSITDLAHQTNKQIEAEALRQSLLKAQREAEAKKRKADAELKAAKEKYEAEKKALEENKKRIKAAEEAEKKRIAALSPEERAVVYAEKELAKSGDDIVKIDNVIKIHNNNISSTNTKIHNLTESLNRANNELIPLRETLNKAKENVRATEMYANDPLRVRIFLNARSHLVRSGKEYNSKEKEITDLRNEINNANNTKNQLNETLNKAKDNATKIRNEHNRNTVKLENAKEALANASLKELLDKAIGGLENTSEYLKHRFTELSKKYTVLAKSKKIKGVEDALKNYEKFKNVLSKKFSVKDRQAIVSALKSIKYEEWAKQFNVYAQGFKYTGYLSTAYDTVNSFIHGIETDDWKPFFVNAEKLVVDKYVVGLLAGVLTSAIVVALPYALTASQVFIVELIVIALLSKLISDNISGLHDLTVDIFNRLLPN